VEVFTPRIEAQPHSFGLTPGWMVRAPRIFFATAVWLNRVTRLRGFRIAKKSGDEANGGRNDCQRAPVNEPIGPVIKGEDDRAFPGNVDQRNQTALRKDGKVAPIDLRAISLEKTGERLRSRLADLHRERQLMH